MTAKCWTRSDAQAEIHRICVRGREAVEALGRIVRDVRQVGEYAGHPDVARLGVDALSALLASHGLGVAEAEIRRQVEMRAASESLLERLNEAVPRDDVESDVDWIKRVSLLAGASTEKFSVDEWWSAASLFGRSCALEGLYLVPLRWRAGYRGGCLSAQPDMPIELKYLFVAPGTPDGEVREFIVGNCMQKFHGSVPLSMFDPSRWKAPQDMLLFVRLTKDVVTPAQRIEIQVDFPGDAVGVPNDVRAVILGRIVG